MLWLILGLIIGVGGFWLVSWTRSKGISLRWYEWLLAVLAVLLALLAVQLFAGSMAELESRAAWLLLLIVGVPAVILGVLAALLPSLRQRGSQPEGVTSEA